ncbi:MAG: FHA domain-containing protein, partial [Pseudomonadota bacterium]
MTIGSERTATLPHYDVRALLESLTGPSRGRVAWLSNDHPHVSVDDDRRLWVSSEDDAIPGAEVRARLRWSGATYEIEALHDHDIWVNGRKVGSVDLLHGDTIEFGEDGPISRVRLCRHAYPTRWPVGEILGDAVAYARTSRRPVGSRLSQAVFDSVRRILLETSLVFRVMVVVALVILTAFVALQYRNNARVEQILEAEALRLEAIAIALTETRQEALTVRDIATLREQLDLQVSTHADRLANLERRLGASARVIGDSTNSVAFLQGAYGLRHIETGKLLRHVLNSEGVPLQAPFGKPVTDVDGKGPPIEFQFT